MTDEELKNALAEIRKRLSDLEESITVIMESLSPEEEEDYDA